MTPHNGCSAQPGAAQRAARAGVQRRRRRACRRIHAAARLARGARRCAGRLGSIVQPDMGRVSAAGLGIGSACARRAQVEAADLGAQLARARAELVRLVDTHAKLEESHQRRKEGNDEIMKHTMHEFSSYFMMCAPARRRRPGARLARRRCTASAPPCQAARACVLLDGMPGRPGGRRAQVCE